MGDPGGIGAEVILKALPAVLGRGVEAVIYGCPAILEWERRALIEAGFEVAHPGDDDRLDVVAVDSDIVWDQQPIGPSGRDGALVQRRALQAAMEAARQGQIDAIVTAPWNKALFAAIDAPVVGHTEVLTEFFEADETVMMLAGPRLRVALVTTHIAVDEVAQALNPDKIGATIEVTAEALRARLGIETPKLAVCGLNPHAGEKGHMGREEIDVITPVIEDFQTRWATAGPTIEGPFPADTLFAKFGKGTPYDAVICMYHDQGLIPLKLLHFGESANITLGLPMIRTSVDHGTAYDIAGRQIADPGSMKTAMEMAIEMAQQTEGRS